MASDKAVIRFTANFEANLAQIAESWVEREAPQAYASLLSELGGTVIGNLERHPRIGRRFFARAEQSFEVRDRVAALRGRFGDAEVREYLSGDYVLLYCIVAEQINHNPASTIFILAIAHCRQLSFDFDAFWRANREGAD